MKLATRFLMAVAKQLAADSLYLPGHPERRRTLDAVYGELTSLIDESGSAVFVFLEGDVVYGDRPIPNLRQWEWATWFAEVGIERLEIDQGVTRAELQDFLQEVSVRLAAAEGAPVRQAYGAGTSLRFGPLAVIGAESRQDLPTASMKLSLEDELRVTDWLHREIADTGQLPVAESSALVQLLSTVMHAGKDVLLPLVELKEHDQYSAIHSINVSVLSMGLAEWLSMASVDVRTVGQAALLHDVGKSMISLEVLNKPGKLDSDEWTLIKMHPAEGAKIMLAAGPEFELQSIVALEHHIGWKGTGGYPAFHYPRQPHPLSRLVQVCDVYDALRTKRPYRGPWTVVRAIDHLESQAGDHLDPECVDAFLSMIRQWEPKQLNHLGVESEPDVAEVGEPTAVLESSGSTS